MSLENSLQLPTAQHVFDTWERHLMSFPKKQSCEHQGFEKLTDAFLLFSFAGSSGSSQRKTFEHLTNVKFSRDRLLYRDALSNKATSSVAENVRWR